MTIRPFQSLDKFIITQTFQFVEHLFVYFQAATVIPLYHRKEDMQAISMHTAFYWAILPIPAVRGTSRQLHGTSEQRISKQRDIPLVGLKCKLLAVFRQRHLHRLAPLIRTKERLHTVIMEADGISVHDFPCPYGRIPAITIIEGAAFQPAIQLGTSVG